ncbi:MAG: rod shape-determining protein [Clostridia bacterium]|nr:rod shape-determining protein [Clostridia bacterium]
MPFFSKNIGIDLGTTNTRIYLKDQGILLNESSAVAYDTRQKKVVRVGNEAKEMLGRTPSYIEVIYPLRDGVIADYHMAEFMLRSFLEKTIPHHGFLGPKIAIGVPYEATEVEKRAVEDVALGCGARQVTVVDEPIASAKGMGLSVEAREANIIVDIGGGTCEVSVISLMGVSASGSIRTAGDAMDNAIINYIRKNYSLLIGTPTASEIKNTIGSAAAYEGESPMSFKGRDLVTGLPKTMSVTPEQIREALSDYVTAILECIRKVLEKTPPELTGDITSSGIYLTGGVSMLKGLDEFLAAETGLKVTVAENPVTCAVEGMGALMKDSGEIKGFKNVVKKNK